MPQLSATFVPGGLDDYYLPEVVAPSPQRVTPQIPQTMQDDLQRLELGDGQSSEGASRRGRDSPSSTRNDLRPSGRAPEPRSTSSGDADADAIIYQNSPQLDNMDADAPSFSPFPKVTGDNIPPADDAKEGILWNARKHVLHSQNVSMQMSWARDALVWVEIAADAAAREPPEKARPSTPRIEHELREDALNIVNYLARQEYPDALYVRAKWLEFGKFGTRVDKREAYNGYKRAADLGHARSEYRLGMLFEQSNDMSKAKEHYYKGMSLKDSASLYRMGMMSLLGQHGESKDYPRGLERIQAAADSSDEDAPQGSYVYGMLVGRDLPDISIPDGLLPYNLETAKMYVEKAAYLGFAKAQLKMGQAYELCQLGCEFHPSFSLHYYGLAARQGLPEAALGVSRWFLFGYEGVFKKNEELAFKYAQEAATAKLPTGEFAMGYYYEIGIHVNKSITDARKWYQLAAEHGNKDAQNRLDSLNQDKSLSKTDHETTTLTRIKSQHGSQRGKRPERFKQPQQMPTLKESGSSPTLDNEARKPSIVASSATNSPRMSPQASPGIRPTMVPEGASLQDPSRASTASADRQSAFNIRPDIASRPRSAAPYPEDGRTLPNRSRSTAPYPEDDVAGGPNLYHNMGPHSSYADRPISSFSGKGPATGPRPMPTSHSVGSLQPQPMPPSQGRIASAGYNRSSPVGYRHQSPGPHNAGGRPYPSDYSQGRPPSAQPYPSGHRMQKQNDVRVHSQGQERLSRVPGATGRPERLGSAPPQDPQRLPRMSPGPGQASSRPGMGRIGSAPSGPGGPALSVSGSQSSTGSSSSKPKQGPATFEDMGIPQGKQEGDCPSGDGPMAADNAEAEARIRRSFDRRVLPLVCCLYVCSYLDRGNIGNAKTAGAQNDLGLDSTQWAWVLNSFYACYVLFEWTTMLWRILPASIFVSILCLCWGAAAMSSGAAHNMGELIVTRCLLGVFEAIFGSGAPYFLSLLYKRRELALRMSILLGMMPLANTFASSLAYGITQIRGSIEPWRLLFIIEGSFSIVLAPFIYLFLIDSPATARFLTAEEQVLAVERLQLRDSTARRGIRWRQVLDGVRDYKTYVHAGIHFCANYSFAALSNFLPTIVRDMGHDAVSAQGLTAPAYFAAFLLCVVTSYLSDRTGWRGVMLAGSAAVAVVGYGLLAGFRDAGARYLGVWLAACGSFPALSLNVTWQLNNQGGDSKRGAGLAIFLTLGQCSSFVSSAVFPTSDAPFYVRGCAVGCGLTGLMLLLALGMHFALEAENRRRDRVYGPVDAEGEVDVTEEGDDHADFRYVTPLLGSETQDDDGKPTNSHHRWQRVREIVLFVWALIATAAVIVIAVWTQHSQQTSGRSAKRNLVFMVSDGMGPASLSLTRSYRQLVHKLPHDDVLVLDKHLAGSSRTRSSNSLVTDSAAGATAFSCGKKSYNGAISMLPDLQPCGSVLEAAKRAGYMTGLVVTTDITDATPACFASHVQLRGMQDEIALQEIGQGPLGRTVDLMLGGGRCHFLPNSTSGSCRGDDVDVVRLAQEKHDWTYISDRHGFDSLKRADGVKLPLLGLFAPSDVPFEMDRRRMNDTYPSLSEMAQTALRILEKATADSDKGFFLMIEGSRIDHAGHINDPAAQVREVLEYDKTFGIAQAFLDNSKADGVLVGTSDHETGGLSLALQEPGHLPVYNWFPHVLANASRSSEQLAADLQRHIASSTLSRDDLKAWINSELVLAGLGIADADDEELSLLADNPDASVTIFAAIISLRAHVGWSTHGHSAVDVNIYASPGSDTDPLRGNVENTDVGRFLSDYLDVDVDAVTRELRRKTKARPREQAGAHKAPEAADELYVSDSL
ncbi:hypothetical protein CP532_5085 [Ophiocordyceps camponoti-leonardi (nom. inval.)]|nr:hypothetical protein CP532_5085 [Ophiocordyceps camponoti-leonardi (nom. inval.)]